ncbi:MAG: GEVED domain-containing protein [Putridiphycobacter sp.]|nr:GEVED domain-containing protein [Putridiphycobacter sp.]
MKTLSYLLFVFAFCSQLQSQVPYKVMMEDNSYNFYEVVEAAETYFKEHPKGKGSGWKGYQRWKWANEYKYYPSGDRTQTLPNFVEQAYENFKSNNPQPEDFYDAGWRDLGPYTIDSITGHYSAGLGRVEDFYVNPNNTQTIYLGSRSGGFWRSTDGGATWNVTTDFLFAAGVDAIAVSPTNPDSILINVKNSRNGSTHGIYRSTDGGITWTITNFNPTTLGWGGLGNNDKIYKIAYHPTIPDRIYIGTSKGIFKSDDNLQTWTQSIPNGDIIDIDFHPTNSNIIYIYDTYYWGSNQDVVMRSSDGGLTYQQSAILTNNNSANGYISVSADCASCVYFASSNGIWKSTDEGTTFTFISNPNSSSDGFAVNDLDTSKMLYGYLDIFGSNDGGITFNQIAYWSQGTYASFNNGQYVHADLRDAKCINGVYYVATDGFLSKSDNNGLTWTILSQGTGIRENYSLGVSQSNHFRSIVGSQDNGTSIKQETTWIEFYGADGMEGIIHPLNDDWMMGSIQNGARRLTKDGGYTQGGATPPGQTGSWIAPLMYDPNDHMRVYSLGENVWRSDNFGTSWVNVGTPSFTGTITEAAIAQNNSNIIIVSKGSNIEKSIDGGNTFSDISNNLPNSSITDIAFAPHDDNIIIVTFASHQNNGQKIYKSINGGTTWTNITHNLGNMPLRKVVIDHTPAHNIYVGAEIGVYTMPLNSTSWTLYNPDLPNMAIEDLEVMWGTNTIRAATWGRGLWEYSLVGRHDFPAIIRTSITDPPTDQTPTPFAPQQVTSVISYDQTITSAYVKWSENNQLFNNTITMSNTVDSTWVTDTPIPGIALNAKIFFKVFAVGINGDTTETYKFMYQAKPTCASAGNMSWQTAITLVDIENINNPSGKTQPYTDYSGTDSCELILGENYDLTVNLNTDGNYTIYARAWIDWNQNGNYTDAGEEFDLGYTQNSADGITSNAPLNIIVPSTAIVGSTSMRVSARYNSYPGPCDSNFDGEVEDYKVNILTPHLDFASTTTPACVGDVYLTNYTGTELDSVLWTLNNGIDTITYTGLSNAFYVIDDTGLFDLQLTGYLYGQAYTLDSTDLFYVNSIDSTTSSTTICEGEAFIFGSQTLFAAGIYTETFATSTCDSVVTLTLSTFEVDTSVTQNSYTLSSNNSNATSYQWVNCNNNYAILPGEIGNSFIASANGSYAVIITDSNCSDTSSCYTISGLGTNNASGAINVTIFPNPSKDIINLKLNDTYQDVTIKIYNELGQLVKDKIVSSQTNIVINIEALAMGIYHLQIEADGKMERFEIIKI